MKTADSIQREIRYRQLALDTREEPISDAVRRALRNLYASSVAHVGPMPMGATVAQFEEWQVRRRAFEWLVVQRLKRELEP